MLNHLSERVSVSGQVQPEEVELLKAQGIQVLINNRPDGEAPDQPTTASIEQACAEHGIEYYYHPIADSLSPDIIKRSTDLIAGTEGARTHLFCTSGKRCTALWCFANAETSGVDEVINSARDAGSELGYLRTMLMTYASAY